MQSERSRTWRTNNSICIADGTAYITDSSDQGPNGIIVVDLDSGESWRKLHDHPSTKAEKLDTFLPVVEGRPFLEHKPDGTANPGAGMGADGTRLYYCPLGPGSSTA